MRKSHDTSRTNQYECTIPIAIGNEFTNTRNANKHEMRKLNAWQKNVMNRY